jgi:prepilin-type N-terminal cleavage/methylation domain-containing protein
MRVRGAFTLIEVLIAIALMGLILPALYQTVDLLRDSNTHLWEYLQKSKKEVQATQTFYLDIASSDGNLTITQGEFDRLCMEQTMNSLYGLPAAKVCWVVLKDKHTLVRVEGIAYHLPVGMEERVEVDPVMQDITLFDVYWQNDKVLVLLQQRSKEPVTFMLQGITKPKPPKKKKKLKKIKKKRPATSQKINTPNEPKPPVSPPPTPIRTF